VKEYVESEIEHMMKAVKGTNQEERVDERERNHERVRKKEAETVREERIDKGKKGNWEG